MADDTFAPYVANNYVNDKGGIEESLMASEAAVNGPQTQHPNGEAGQPLSPGAQEMYDRITGKLPRVELPQDALKSVPQTTPGKSYLEDLTGNTAKKLIEGLAATGTAVLGKTPLPKAGWIGVGTTALTTLLDHGQEIPDMVGSIPLPKSFPAECDGITCNRMD